MINDDETTMSFEAHLEEYAQIKVMEVTARTLGDFQRIAMRRGYPPEWAWKKFELRKEGLA